MRDAMSLARYIIDKCSRENHPISNLQLQKILYYIQLHFLVKNNTTLFNDPIEAWPFGPVVSRVYYQYCGFGAMPIRWRYEEAEMFSFQDDEKSAVDRIIQEKINVSPWALVKDTHQEGKAWSKIFQDGEGNRKVIPNDLIRELHG